jgi:hypothetical protein
MAPSSAGQDEAHRRIAAETEAVLSRIDVRPR